MNILNFIIEKQKDGSFSAQVRLVYLYFFSKVWALYYMPEIWRPLKEISNDHYVISCPLRVYARGQTNFNKKVITQTFEDYKVRLGIEKDTIVVNKIKLLRWTIIT